MDDTLFLTITDEGEGLDPELVPHLFDEYIATNTNLPADGLGLSLAIAQQIVLAHQGAIHVESAKGAGTTFRILLPIT